MLEITIPASEIYDSENNLFITVHEQTIKLEHSLVSLHKWEKKYHKPFISEEKMTHEETVDYIRCMTITQNVDPLVYKMLTPKNIEEVNKYIEDPMTATWISSANEQEGKTWGKKKKETITAELIYYWMIALQIPMECQKWHLNSLLMLIQVCNIKNDPKKMNKKDRYLHNKALNESRKAKYHTRG